MGEKSCRTIKNKGIACYCPLVTQVRQWSDRRKKVGVPLFNFLFSCPKQKDLVFPISWRSALFVWLGKPLLFVTKKSLYKKWLDPSQANDVSLLSFQVDSIRIGPFQVKSLIVQVTVPIMCWFLESLCAENEDLNKL
jgi:hypothetical protein